jgi:hypothetical protein
MSTQTGLPIVFLETTVEESVVDISQKRGASRPLYFSLCSPFSANETFALLGYFYVNVQIIAAKVLKMKTLVMIQKWKVLFNVK